MTLDRQAAIELLLERYEQPGHRGTLPEPPARSATATNPRCGDVVTMFAEVRGDLLGRVSFEGAGCTVSQVAADLVAELAEGRSLATVASIQVGDVLALLGRDVVRTRIDCAGLALRTLQQALQPAPP
jgi:nitrogen fixation protein NifU and related proteins